MKDMLYVHIDVINNSVLSKGLTAIDFQQAITKPPKNLLLLSAIDDVGEYENHTGFKIVKGKQVNHFFQAYGDKQEKLKWIDFQDEQSLKQLTPVEISELLYFGHTNSHLHSPFFYKLQNKYVFLNVNSQINKIYYRHMEVFYQVLAQKLQNMVEHHLFVMQRGLFKKAIHVSKLDPTLLEKLRINLQEGIVFNFRKFHRFDGTCVVPIYLVEDKLRRIEDIVYKEDAHVADLRYFRHKKEWQLDIL